ncbi:hypothetical protein [Rhizobium leguminosarum]
MTQSAPARSVPDLLDLLGYRGSENGEGKRQVAGVVLRQAVHHHATEFASS